MFTITKTMNRNGHTISIGDRNPTQCDTTEDIAQCVYHYFGGNDRRQKHKPKLCPFCKQITAK